MKLSEYVDEERGRAAALAAALNLPPILISQWVRDRKVPLDRCVPIEIATDKRVTCEELRPDKSDYFAYLRASAGAEEEAA